jgi:U2 small nuclear ribonucleoprotein A'
MRLTHFLISNSPQYVNCCREWELDVRGNKIPLIENLVSTEDQFDTLNLCDNEISKLDNFPSLQRLKTLLVCNNRVVRLDASIATSLPNLTSLVLTSNHISHLAEVDALVGAKLLRNLSLHDNDICKKKNYRAYVLFRLPQLKVLDFQKIKTAERDAAMALFSGAAGERLLQEIAAARTMTADGQMGGGENRLTEAQINEIKAAINRATTIEEVNRLEKALKSGQYPVENK